MAYPVTFWIHAIALGGREIGLSAWLTGGDK
jgi:hypothetical protein